MCTSVYVVCVLCADVTNIPRVYAPVQLLTDTYLTTERYYRGATVQRRVSWGVWMVCVLIE